METNEVATKNKNLEGGVLKAAWLIAVVTIASKLTGFVRDMVVANFYGATLVSDAYFYALQNSIHQLHLLLVLKEHHLSYNYYYLQRLL